MHNVRWKDKPCIIFQFLLGFFNYFMTYVGRLRKQLSIPFRILPIEIYVSVKETYSSFQFLLGFFVTWPGVRSKTPVALSIPFRILHR